ncbi:hypothetical protein F503_03103 [Ophiostoma piceae UAMH 11346]|uniref:Uncharacterized protein n=1 Tax=Ophiostoma piceae (strain UAMH 11346) TaxID=1262450 RepID=S3C4D4_OPHP1|nr:hypothetical protein F503_03103 [Ophiostoma piceae UAMH 11346]
MASAAFSASTARVVLCIGQDDQALNFLGMQLGNARECVGGREDWLGKIGLESHEVRMQTIDSLVHSFFVIPKGKGARAGLGDIKCSNNSTLWTWLNQ